MELSVPPCSVVLHDDVIPRASLQNVEELRCRLQHIQWRDMVGRPKS
jgi:hypothetical protein